MEQIILKSLSDGQGHHLTVKELNVLTGKYETCWEMIRSKPFDVIVECEASVPKEYVWNEAEWQENH